MTVPFFSEESDSGSPILYGPFSLDFSDIPNDGDGKDLFTVRAGDLLYYFFDVVEGAILWDTGNVRFTLGGDEYTRFDSLFPLLVSSTQILRVVFTNTIRPLRYSDVLNSYVGGPPIFEAAPLGWGQALVLGGGNQNVRWDSGTPEAQYTAEIRAKSSTPVKQVLFGAQQGDWVGTDDAGNAALYYGNELQAITTAVPLCDGDWHSIALVVTDTPSAQLYVDGLLVGTDLVTTLLFSGFRIQYVGSNGNIANAAWTGSVDELALSATAQYSTDYVPATAPFPVDRPGLLALYRFDGDLLNSVLALPPTQGHTNYYAMIARAVT